MGKKIVWALVGVGFLFLSIVPAQLLAQPSEEYLIVSLDVLVQRTLHAYNREDYIMFYKYFAKKMDPVKAKRFFNAEYISLYKKELGSIISTRLILGKTNLDHDLPELVYEAKFEKFAPVLVTVNFVNQNDDYRITRVRFDRVYNNSSLGGIHAP